MSKNTPYSKSADDWEQLDIIDHNNVKISSEAFTNALVRSRFTKKKQLTIRLDLDVLNWFKSQGKGYQTKINSILKAYKDIHSTQ